MHARPSLNHYIDYPATFAGLKTCWMFLKSYSGVAQIEVDVLLSLDHIGVHGPRRQFTLSLMKKLARSLCITILLHASNNKLCPFATICDSYFLIGTYIAERAVLHSTHKPYLLKSVKSYRFTAKND